MRVLIIEDSQVDFRLVERALGSGFTLWNSSSLKEGLALGARDPFDLVILDLTLDDSSGFETFQKAHAALSHVPIIVLSGVDDEELALRAVASGAQDYVRKAQLLDYPLDRTARYAIERQRTQRELRESERFARATVNSLDAQIAILDENGTILAVNTAWKRFAATNALCDNRYAVGANYIAVCEQSSCGGEPGTAPAAAIRAILGGSRNEYFLEYACRSPKDEDRWFVMRAAPFEGEGLTRVVISHEDITSRKLAERLASEQCGLREAVAGMEQVLGVVGHELRTPLAAIRAISEFLTDGARDIAEADKFLHDISDEVDRMSDTVNNLLEAARLNSGRAKWNWSEIDLSAVIEEAVSSFRTLVDAECVQLQVRMDCFVDRMVGDSDAIRRLLINLLSNAMKFTTKGSIEVSVTQNVTEKDTFVQLIVRDSGCGIAPELVSRLGQAFALNSGVVGSNCVKGTGLGLAICKGIAAAHDGELLIESAPGQGTAITARLRIDLERATYGDTVYQAAFEEVTT